MDVITVDINSALEIVKADSNYRVLTRLNITDFHQFENAPSDEPIGRLAVIDTETTGLKVDEGDRIIDLSIATCEYGKNSGHLYRVISRYDSLEDPEFPIPHEVTRLTGISDDMVKGEKIDENKIDKVLDGVSLIICHNASFDRGFLEARYPLFSQMHFGCSLHEIPWDLWATKSSKLDYLGFRFNLFHDAHRARADVDMLMMLLSQSTPDMSTTALSLLINSARKKLWHIQAIDLPFDNKNLAKARGYKWFEGSSEIKKSWYIQTEDLDSELEFLKEAGCRNPVFTPLTARERYKPLKDIMQRFLRQ
ncbi:3'-5' exonuclease [Ferrovum sp. PN-J185]|uniref:3'-5' exonuclease n=1 Tax=Ferrovum sp. PN-J185 TaxID=1356306 RepID=UPI0018D4AF69|nr:3'-5' exonuclease [Ferrovum sp. PN-J185]